MSDVKCDTCGGDHYGEHLLIPSAPNSASISEGIPRCMKCAAPVVNKFADLCDTCKPSAPTPEECFRCLGTHASVRCDDGVHNGSALPYPQVHSQPPKDAGERPCNDCRKIKCECGDRPIPTEKRPDLSKTQKGLLDAINEFRPTKDAGAREFMFYKNEPVDGSVNGRMCCECDPTKWSDPKWTEDYRSLRLIEYAAFEKLGREYKFAVEVANQRGETSIRLGRELAAHKKSRANLEKWNDQLVDELAEANRRKTEWAQMADSFAGQLNDMERNYNLERAKSAALVEALMAIAMTPAQRIQRDEALAKWGKG